VRMAWISSARAKPRRRSSPRPREAHAESLAAERPARRALLLVTVALYPRM
jgi:hypothetical protein